MREQNTSFDHDCFVCGTVACIEDLNQAHFGGRCCGADFAAKGGSGATDEHGWTRMGMGGKAHAKPQRREGGDVARKSRPDMALPGLEAVTSGIEAASSLVKETSLLDKETPLFDEETSSLDEETPLFDKESPLFNEEVSLFDKETSLFEEETPDLPPWLIPCPMLVFSCFPSWQTGEGA
jgi:hypothetical protein